MCCRDEALHTHVCGRIFRILESLNLAEGLGSLAESLGCAQVRCYRGLCLAMLKPSVLSCEAALRRQAFAGVSVLFQSRAQFWMARLPSVGVGRCLTQERAEFLFPGTDEVSARNGGLGLNTARLFTSRVASCFALLVSQMCPKLVAFE